MSRPLVEKLRADARSEGNLGTHLKEMVAGRLTGPLNLAAAGAILALPGAELLKSLILSGACYAQLEQQLNGHTVHAASDRALAKARLASLHGRAPVGQRVKAAALRVAESAARGGAALVSAAGFIEGLRAVGGLDPNAAVHLFVAGEYGLFAGAAMGALGVLKRTAGRGLANKLRSSRLAWQLARTERAVGKLLSTPDALAGDKHRARVEKMLRVLFRSADEELILDEVSSRRLREVAKRFDALVAWGAQVSGSEPGEKKRSKAKRHLLRRSGALALVAALLVNQGVLPRVPVGFTPPDLIPDATRRELARLVWNASVQTQHEGLAQAKAIAQQNIPWADARIFQATTTAELTRAFPKGLVPMAGEWRHDPPRIEGAWNASVRADVEHFYFAALLASLGGPVWGAPLSAGMSAAYEGPMTLIGAKIANPPLKYEGGYQLRQFLRADLPGALVGALSTLLEYPAPSPPPVSK